MPARSQAQKREYYQKDSSGRTRPVIATLPTVSGTNTVGQTLTGTNGTFTGNATITITRQWTRNGNPIANATGATYVLAAGDSGKTVRFQNIATNPYGKTVSESAARSIA